MYPADKADSPDRRGHPLFYLTWAFSRTFSQKPRANSTGIVSKNQKIETAQNGASFHVWRDGGVHLELHHRDGISDAPLGVPADRLSSWNLHSCGHDIIFNDFCMFNR